MIYKSLMLVLAISFFSSCSLINRKGTWGKNAIYPVKLERIIESVKKNASSAHVWGPLAGASFFAFARIDEKVANWVVHEGDVFKNKEFADKWSDNFNDIQKYEMYGIILLTPSQPEDKGFGGYLLNKIRGGLTINIAASSSRFGVHQVRKVVHRERPNKMDMKSLPSGHSAEAASRSAIVRKGSAAIDMNRDLHFAVNSFNTGMAIATCWARIEGKRHYPSDVMAGYAFGSFISGVVYDSLINYDPNQSVSIIPQKDKYMITYTLSF